MPGERPVRLTTRSCVWPLHLEHRFRGRLDILVAVAGPHDRVRRAGVEHAVAKEGAADVDADDLADHEPVGGLPAVEIVQRDDLQQAAFERRRARRDARRRDDPAGRGLKSRERELVGLRRHGGGGGVHRLSEGSGRHVPDELAGCLDVGDAVLGTAGGKGDHRRRVAHRVEEAVRRKVGDTAGAQRGDPPDRTRRDNGLERIMRQPVTGGGLVEVAIPHGHERSRRSGRQQPLMGVKGPHLGKSESG